MGRKPAQRKRLGHNELAAVTALRKQVLSFSLAAIDASVLETRLNTRLVKHLQVVRPDVTSRGTHVVGFVGERFVPDAVLLGRGAYPLLAVECKCLRSAKDAKRCWKEGLAQAALYSRRYKVTFLVLYDFTLGSVYRKAFGRGNKVESSFGAALREMRIHVMVVAPRTT